MRTVEASSLDSIVPSRPLMVWCTCASRKYEYYLRRIAAWRRQLSYLDADFYAFCDGEAGVECSEDPGDLTMVVIRPALGRKSVMNFPGWKRSLRYAMEVSMKYRFCVHVESDCFVKDWTLLRKLASTDGKVTCGFNDHYGFVEFSASVLNDRQVRRRLMDEYSSESSWNDERCFEISVSWLRSFPAFGKSIRLEHAGDVDSPRFSILCQCSPEYVDEACRKYGLDCSGTIVSSTSGPVPTTPHTLSSAASFR